MVYTLIRIYFAHLTFFIFDSVRRTASAPGMASPLQGPGMLGNRLAQGAVLRAPLGWFDETPSGRITSRFSGDLNGVDIMFAEFSEALFQFIFLELAVVTTSIYLNPFFAVIGTVYIGEKRQ